jgi:hypothetical protein
MISSSNLRRFLIIGFCATALSLHAQDNTPSRNIDETYQFDERGDAKLEVSFQYGAAQWATWKEQYGDHPDMLLRNLRYQFASSVIDDFSLDKDEVHRHAIARLKGRAVARYRDGGEFVIDVPKNMKLVSGAERDWIFTNSNLINGEIINQTIHAKLPAGAQDARFSPGGDFGQIAYQMNLTPPRPKGWVEAGVVLLLLGCAAGFASTRVA